MACLTVRPKVYEINYYCFWMNSSGLFVLQRVLNEKSNLLRKCKNVKIKTDVKMCLCEKRSKRLQVKDVQFAFLYCWSRPLDQNRCKWIVDDKDYYFLFLFLRFSNCSNCCAIIISRLTPMDVRVDGDIVAVTYALETVWTLASKKNEKNMLDKVIFFGFY